MTPAPEPIHQLSVLQSLSVASQGCKLTFMLPFSVITSLTVILPFLQTGPQLPFSVKKGWTPSQTGDSDVARPAHGFSVLPKVFMFFFKSIASM